MQIHLVFFVLLFLGYDILDGLKDIAGRIRGNHVLGFSVGMVLAEQDSGNLVPNLAEAKHFPDVFTPDQNASKAQMVFLDDIKLNAENATGNMFRPGQSRDGLIVLLATCTPIKPGNVVLPESHVKHVENIASFPFSGQHKGHASGWKQEASSLKILLKAPRLGEVPRQLKTSHKQFYAIRHRVRMLRPAKLPQISNWWYMSPEEARMGWVYATQPYSDTAPPFNAPLLGNYSPYFQYTPVYYYQVPQTPETFSIFGDLLTGLDVEERKSAELLNDPDSGRYTTFLLDEYFFSPSDYEVVSEQPTSILEFLKAAGMESSFNNVQSNSDIYSSLRDSDFEPTLGNETIVICKALKSYGA